MSNSGDWLPDSDSVIYGWSPPDRRLVWLRSKEVSYSSEVLIVKLNKDGTVIGMPGFVWEPWP